MLVYITDVEASVWEQCPGLDLLTEFKKFKEQEGEERSSNIIKSIFYIWDPKSNLRDSGYDEASLIKDMNENVIGDSDFDWEDYEDFKAFYMDHNLSEAENLLKKYRNEIDGLDQLLSTWKWTKEDAAERAKLVSTYKALFDDYLEVKAQVDIEHESLSEMRGGYTKSKFENYG